MIFILMQKMWQSFLTLKTGTSTRHHLQGTICKEYHTHMRIFCFTINLRQAILKNSDKYPCQSSSWIYPLVWQVESLIFSLTHPDMEFSRKPKISRT